MILKDVWPLVGAPIAGFVMAIYHRYVINPRLIKVEKDLNVVEKETEENTILLTEVKTDVRWIRKILDKEFNNK